MDIKAETATAGLLKYCQAKSSEEPSIMKELVEASKTSQVVKETSKFDLMGEMCTTSFIQGLIRAGGYTKMLELGVFTGYTTLAMALAGGPDTKVIACDISDELANVGKPFWKKAGVEDKIDMRVGKASDTIDWLLSDGQGGTFDLIFIDADKISYPEYYEKGLELLRPRGILLIDNTLWRGQVIDPSVQDEDTNAIRITNQTAHSDSRVHTTLLSVGDGVLMCVKL